MNFIDDNQIDKLLITGDNPTLDDIEIILNKAAKREKLTLLDVAMLLNAKDEEQVSRIYEIAGKIKEEIYGKRVVVFAPLYVSNHCVNNCTYCGYKRDNNFVRRKLTQQEIAEEAKILQSKGHKRLAFEAGEDPVNIPIDYVIESIKTIYSNSDIRRINVNIAATTVDNYKKLKEAEIGTYILFQETYHKESFEKQHPKSLKGDFERQLLAFDRAMDAGIDDVGAGVLFGLYNYKYEVLSLLMHNQHLENKYKVGFHTISVPRLKKAEGMSIEDYPNIITDEQFKRIVTVLRIALPYVGLILSTRETKSMREELLRYGVSQISAGSNTGVGGYKEEETGIKEVSQFSLSDERSVKDVMNKLIDDDYIPSFCTACYRSNRTGDRFMKLAKSGQIGKICEPNALLTLMEYLLDLNDINLLEKGKNYIYKQVEKLDKKTKEVTLKKLKQIESGDRDLFL